MQIKIGNNFPVVSSFGEYSNDNYGMNTIKLEFPGKLIIFYSYSEIVAFRDYDANNGGGLVVCENIWSTTTGKHLNWLDGGDKKSRKKRAEFEELLKETLERHVI